MSRVLVAGGTGMIGSRIAADLVAQGDEVAVLSRTAAADTDPSAIAGMARLVGDYAASPWEDPAI